MTIVKQLLETLPPFATVATLRWWWPVPRERHLELFHYFPPLLRFFVLGDFGLIGGEIGADVFEMGEEEMKCWRVVDGKVSNVAVFQQTFNIKNIFEAHLQAVSKLQAKLCHGSPCTRDTFPAGDE